MSYCIWDVETTIHALNKRKASPFHPDNYVVASGYFKPNMPAPAADYFGRTPPTGDWFTKLLTGTKFLVGFNIKFDVLHAIQDKGNYEAWKTYVAKGGQVWDCQLAEYLLHGMAREQHMLSLDEVAPRYGGHLKNDAVAALWQAGINTPDIDKDMLLEYLIGAPADAEDLGDIGNTREVFLGQVSALRARGSLQSVLLNMDSLLCTIEMEHNGMYVDKQRGLDLAKELAARGVTLREELTKSLPKELPFEFNWGSRVQLSALVFGGQVKYIDKEIVVNDDGEPVYFQLKEKHYVKSDGSTTAVEPTDAGADVLEYATFASGKNKGTYKTKQVTVPDVERGPKERNADFYYKFPGYTKPDPKWESSTEGVYSVASDVIKALGNRDIPFLKQLAELSSLNKDLGTYYMVTDEATGISKGMLTLLDGNNIIHHSLNHTSTVTGRFSSSNPNLQNVPKEGKSEVKSVFVSRFDKGKIIQSDFSALEIYVQANLTGDKQLIADLIKGLDMHCLRAATAHDVPYDDVLTMCKDRNHPEHGKWDTRRTHAKIFSFQRAYGAGAAKIAETTGMSVDDVNALIEAEEKMYSRMVTYYEEVTEAITANRVPTQRFTAHPEVPGVTCQLARSHYTTPDGKLYAYSESPSPAWLYKQKKIASSFSPTEIKNYVVQGTGGEWAKAAMNLVVRAFYEHDNFGGEGLLVNQVHDAVFLDCSDASSVRAAALLHACMEEASAYMSYVFKWDLEVPVPSETTTGSSMIEELGMPAGFDEQVSQWRKWVRDRYMPGFIPSFEESDNG